MNFSKILSSTLQAAKPVFIPAAQTQSRLISRQMDPQVASYIQVAKKCNLQSQKLADLIRLEVEGTHVGHVTEE